MDSEVSTSVSKSHYFCIVEWDNGQISNYKVMQNTAGKGCSGVTTANDLAKEEKP